METALLNDTMLLYLQVQYLDSKKELKIANTWLTDIAAIFMANIDKSMMIGGAGQDDG